MKLYICMYIYYIYRVYMYMYVCICIYINFFFSLPQKKATTCLCWPLPHLRNSKPRVTRKPLLQSTMIPRKSQKTRNFTKHPSRMNRQLWLDTMNCFVFYQSNNILFMYKCKPTLKFSIQYFLLTPCLMNKVSFSTALSGNA